MFSDKEPVILKTRNALDYYESLYKQQRSEMDKLFHQKAQLEEFVKCFESNNTKYLEIKENIKQEIEGSLTNSKQLIRMAFLSLIESLRNDINKFQLLFYQMSTDNAAITPSQSLTPSYGSQNSPIFNINEKPFQDYNDPTEAFQNFVLDEAEKLYDKLIDDSLISKQSDNNPSIQKIAHFTYRKEGEERIIKSESENENVM
jgi:hypothetical protein